MNTKEKKLLTKMYMIVFIIEWEFKHKGTYDEQREEIEKRMKELNTKDLINELLPIYHRAEQEKILGIKLISIDHDKLRFFNQQGVTANFHHYLKLKTWTKEQAIALSFGKDPKEINWETLTEYKEKELINEPIQESSFINSYEQSREIILSDKKLKDEAQPREFLKWFNDNKIPVNENLQKLAIKLGIMKNEDYAWIENILSSNNPPSSSISCEKELSEKSEKTHLHIIGALLEFIEGNISKNKHPDFTSQTKLIELLVDKNDGQGLQGLTKRTLEEKFAKAKKLLKSE